MEEIFVSVIEKQIILNIFELLMERGLLTLEEMNQLKFKVVNDEREFACDGKSSHVQ